MTGPTVIAFDVNGTLSDTAGLAEVFESVGLDGAAGTGWLAQVLRDGSALALTGSNAAFADVARSLLPGDLGSDAVEQVLSSFERLPLHPDVGPGLTRLATSHGRLVCLSNGAATVAENLLRRHGLRDRVQRCLSVADAPTWKPGAQAYAYAAKTCGVPIEELMLVAAHPWDLHGAGTAGAQTAWVNRNGATYPDHFRPPDVTVSSLTDLLP